LYFVFTIKYEKYVKNRSAVHAASGSALQLYFI